MFYNNGEENFNATLLKQHELLGFHLNPPSQSNLTDCMMVKKDYQQNMHFFFSDFTLGGTMEENFMRT